MSELRATYRLQLDGQLDLRAARELVPYLRGLGVSHLYLSPVLQARAGSTHGYDVVDPTRVSEELGGEDALRELADAGMGVIVDVVPNHMAADPANRWWSDPELRQRFFDVDPVTGRHRRFFDIDGLAGVRQEDGDVFAVTHAKLLELVGAGVIDGLRVDHPDGLADPAGYLRRLRAAGVPHIWVEKILGVEEALRDWPVEGTVGYDFMTDVTSLFVDGSRERAMTDLYAEFTGERRAFWQFAREAQLEQARGTFGPEVERLLRVAPLPGVAEALARLPVYRTYVDPAHGTVDPADRGAIEYAQMAPALERALLLEEPVSREFVTRFQQTSPAITAKGIEDTAFYRYARLLALNEVGGDPGRFGISVERFHANNAQRARRWPRSLLATSTHDTKRSGDVRARIAVLAGQAPRWREHILRWHELTEPLRSSAVPDRLEEYWLYQTLVGAWPIDADRLTAHMHKAMREAKIHMSWASPDAERDRLMGRFCERLLGYRPFLESFEPFAAEVAAAGGLVAAAQVLLKLTCPGVPDIYQGDELELLSLVDPDNRRPVDWQRRRDALSELQAGGVSDLKLQLIVAALALRARRPDTFAGAYTPLPAGPAVCAFTRGRHEVLVAVRVSAGGVPSLVLPEEACGEWRDVLDGAVSALGTRVGLDDVLDASGVALLERV